MQRQEDGGPICVRVSSFYLGSLDELKLKQDIGQLRHRKLREEPQSFDLISPPAGNMPAAGKVSKHMHQNYKMLWHGTISCTTPIHAGIDRQ